MKKDRLIEIFDDRVSNSAEDLLVYSYDSFQKKGSVECVVWPINVEEIAKLIRYAKRTGMNLVVRGGGSNLVGSSISGKAIIMDMSLMNKIYNFNGDSILLEPGCVLAKLNRFLKKHNLNFPVIPESKDVCTLGGMIATNAKGKRLNKIKDFVQELEVIDGTGKLLNLKGEGIDDFIGSEGLIGVITLIKLKIVPIVNKSSIEYFEFEYSIDMIDKIKSLKTNVISINYYFDGKFKLIVEYSDETGSVEVSRKKEIWDAYNEFKLMMRKKNLSKEDFSIYRGFQKILDFAYNEDIFFYGDIENIVFCVDVLKFGSKNKIYDFMQEQNIKGLYGIGFKKLKYLDDLEKRKIFSLKEKYDEEWVLNKGVENVIKKL